MTDHTTDIRAPSLTLAALFLKFLGFGALAFGGPVAQIAMLRAALVDDESWITSARFNRLLAVLQVLPGPEAHELCVHLGMIARGRIGGVLAGLGFMLPGFGFMLAAGWLYVTWIVGDAGLGGVLLGVQVVVLAIILRAVVRIGQHVIDERMLGVVAVASGLATLVGVPFWIPLAVAGLACTAAARRPVIAAVILAVAIAAVMAVRTVGLPAIAASPVPVTLAGLFVAGLKGGLLTFGGAYTAIPYVRADTVGRGWIGDSTFLDGVALAGILPAPLVIFATFVGYVAGGMGGAVAITLGMFLPAFAFSLIFFERLEELTENPALHRALAGIAAAVVGIIAATFVQLTLATADRVTQPSTAIMVFAAALAIAWRVKGAWVTPLLVTGGGIVGWLAFASQGTAV